MEMDYLKIADMVWRLGGIISVALFLDWLLTPLDVQTLYRAPEDEGNDTAKTEPPLLESHTVNERTVHYE